MPIKINNELPAKERLEAENIFVMTEKRAQKQDIRPLKIAFLNLMPTKIDTETQFMRLLGNTPLQVDIELLQMKSHVSKNTSAEHLMKFYKCFDDIRNEKYDGLIVTGAPVENMPFEEVDYWKELTEIFDWAEHNVYSSLFVCWGAQAALNYYYGVPKYPLPEKMFGIFPHKRLSYKNPLMRGFDEVFLAPHSRHTEVKREDIEGKKGLKILAESDIAGVYIVEGKKGRQIFVTGHCEYDYDTLSKEYFRDVDKGLPIKIPYNYFPNDDPSKKPPLTWRSHGSLLFSNWLNYFVYQATPYDQTKIR